MPTPPFDRDALEHELLTVIDRNDVHGGGAAQPDYETASRIAALALNECERLTEENARICRAMHTMVSDPAIGAAISARFGDVVTAALNFATRLTNGEYGHELQRIMLTGGIEGVDIGESVRRLRAVLDEDPDAMNARREQALAAAPVRTITSARIFDISPTVGEGFPGSGLHLVDVVTIPSRGRVTMPCGCVVDVDGQTGSIVDVCTTHANTLTVPALAGVSIRRGWHTEPYRAAAAARVAAEYVEQVRANVSDDYDARVEVLADITGEVRYELGDTARGQGFDTDHTPTGDAALAALLDSTHAIVRQLLTTELAEALS